MKIFLVVLAEILLTLLFVLFAANNYDGIIQFTCPIDKQLYTISYVTFAAITYMIGGLSTVLIYTAINITEGRTISAYKKEREKNTIETAEKDDKIKALENKVKTLEKALDSVIKPNDK